ncbi:cbb3-type cytochrome c oxidase subunit II [Puia sp.]|jgi:cytochrome c oxidase cbb3-type subunit 2|uniref:cbb3-type cytochrome c oxidase subunit II n=1 Tax=Puia sp. TaxID=2045100 RepID=UPI002F3F0513
MEFFDNHKQLFRTSFLFFGTLTLFVAILPALTNQRNNSPLPGSEPLSADARQGKLIFIANGCVGCHTQQVRNIDMDKSFGSRPSVSADYARIHRTSFWQNTATLMGSERTGPDLTNIGNRQPLESWQLTHLFNPRIVVKESIMPAYPWLFEIKDSAEKGDITISVPDLFLNAQTGVVVATKEARQLVAYLQSLKQTNLPDGRPIPAFLYPIKAAAGAGKNDKSNQPDGGALYATYCQSCHQPNGEGLKGAFPSLKGSAIVNDPNPETHLSIIINGYEGRVKEGYPPMPPVGTTNNLSAAEISAIMNYERTSWGNAGKTTDAATIEHLTTTIKK